MRQSTAKIIELMQIYAERGRDLSSILHLIGRSRTTAMKYARQFGIVFPDHKRRTRKVVGE